MQISYIQNGEFANLKLIHIIMYWDCSFPLDEVIIFVAVFRAATCPALGWTSSFGRFVLPSPALTHLSSPSHFCPALGHFTLFLFFILGIFNKKSILTKGLNCLCIIGYFCPKKIFKFDSKVTEMISKTHKFLNKREYQKVLLS